MATTPKVQINKNVGQNIAKVATSTSKAISSSTSSRMNLTSTSLVKGGKL